MKALLTIAGSDSGGGAGIQADLKTFYDFGMHGTSAITAVTAQNTCGVQGVNFLPAAFVIEQMDSIINDMDIKAAKLGMLGNKEITGEVARKLEQYSCFNERLVVDPVMVSASGDVLLAREAIENYKEKLIPMATVLTPNLKEASLLTEMEIKTTGQMEKAAKILYSMGPGLILLKGGDGSDNKIIDMFYDGEFHYMETERYPGKFHGTGCILSAAITACLAREEKPLQAAKTALQYLQKKLKNPYSPGKGTPLPG